MKKIFNYILTISLICISTSCVSKKELIRTHPIHKGVALQLQPYVDDFIKDSKGIVSPYDVYKITMGFKKYNKSSIVGMCVKSFFFREIDIDPTWWESNTSKLIREQLIFHELGHCVLNREHVYSSYNYMIMSWIDRFLFKLGVFKTHKLLSDGCPISYMNPYVLSFYCIKFHHNYYINELFGFNTLKYLDN